MMVSTTTWMWIAVMSGPMVVAEQQTRNSGVYGSHTTEMKHCGAFIPGGACSPNTEYVTLLEKADASQCLAACENQSTTEYGCCWHRLQPTGNGDCQWVPGGVVRYYGGDRSSTNCSGPEPVYPPEQLHIAFGPNASTMVVQWAQAIGNVPSHQLPSPVLRFWPDGNPSMVTYKEPSYISQGPGNYRQFRVTMQDLLPNSRYTYSVGWLPHNGSDTNTGWTDNATLRTPPVSESALDNPVRLVMFGDLGWTDDQILPYLKDECAEGAVDAIVLFGDMVYWDNGENENSFMRDVAAMTTTNGISVPVMVSPGNGDWGGGSYSRFKAQWAMPGWETLESLYHSFDLGRAHIVGINTEDIEHSDASKMLAWLENDLAMANTVETRKLRPWIVVHFHRPAYSTGNSDAVPFQIFEPLMYKYGVDIVFAGHVHNQERTFPVRNGSVVPGPNKLNPYFDARAPVYVVSGNPGNAEETDIFQSFQPWTAWRSYHFGYSHMVVHNSTTMSIDFLSTNLGGEITDQFDLIKTRTCNFGDNCVSIPMARVKEQTRGINSHSPIKAATKLLDKWRLRNTVVGGVPPEQKAALVVLYNATNGPGWNRSTNWLSGDPCDPQRPWYGVSCARVTERTLQSLWNLTAPRDGITAVHLSTNNLVGQIPEGLGTALAPTLQLFDLSGNVLYGSIPEDILTGLPRLHTLYIEPKLNDYEFRLKGSLPENMGTEDGLPNLRFLGLSRNQLVGQMPSSLGQLPCHVTSASGSGHIDPSLHGQVGCLIWLEHNNLTGTISKDMCSATYNEVYVSGNNLSCPRPCLHVAYGSWESCSKNTSTCTPC